MRLDFSEIRELENKQAEEGIQDLTVFGAKLTKSKNGNNMLVLDMKDANEGFVRDHLLLEGAGAFKMKQFMGALNLSEEDVEAMEPTDFIGMVVSAEVILEDYEGTDFSKIKKYIGA